MSTLLVQRLSSDLPLAQEFSLTLNKRYHLGAICPYIYMHNAPAGSFKFSFVKSDGSFSFEKTFTSEDIKESLSTTSNYAHVFKPFIPDSILLMEKGSYTATLEAVSGYELTFDSFIGWIQQHEDLNNEMDYTPFSDSENPLATRLKVYKKGIE